MRVFRLFVSSPGDVDVERRRAENIVGRLNGEFFGLARLEAIRWETEFYRADATFQTQIPPAADCDIVIGILKWRLGTELPPDFAERLPDGRSYPSGTAYELLTAVRKRQSGADLPDVFVFRYSGGSPWLEIEDPSRERVEAEWAALRDFFQTWFVTAQGQFIAALNQYASEDQFEDQLESLLRKWLADKVADGKVVSWPAAKGSPFRGLDVFGAKHAAVFFGRSADVRKAGDLWRAAAQRGSAFLLVVGASGSGKSSLARAGLVPRITTPGVVPDVDAWRVAAMRPSDSPDGPFAALATALLRTVADLPPEDQGRAPALAEIAEGDSKTPAELAAVLAHADAAAVRPIVNALTRIGERTRERERYGRAVRCNLVLLLDQLDELFAPSVAAERRERFADLLAALVTSGRVWPVATLRADLYQPMLAVPSLKALKDAGASYDLVPPGPAELAEIVRQPAKAAGLVFEADPATGERVDERLLREADRPDMLPLVQLALSRLWEARERRGADVVLPWAAFDRIGGVKGIIEEAAEAAYGALDAGARLQLGSLLRRLAELSHGGGGAVATITARAVPLADAASGQDGRRLVDALVAARLLTLDGHADAISVRLAHQRVLADWARAAAIVAESAEFYRVRETVDDQRLRWEASKRRGDLLLARGLPLAEARAMVDRYGAEMGPEIQAYVAASRRRANRAQTLGWIAAAAFAGLAAAAGIAAGVAHDRTRNARIAEIEAVHEKESAQRNFAVAKAVVDSLVFDIAEGLKTTAGVRIQTVQRILQTARTSVERLLETAPADQGLLRTRLGMLGDFTDTYLTVGDTRDAMASAAEALSLARQIRAAAPDDPQALRDLASSLKRAGDVQRRGDDRAAALKSYEDCVDTDERLIERNADDLAARRDKAARLNDVGDLRLAAGDQPGALEAFRESIGIVRDLAARHPDDLQARRDLASSLTRIGNALLKTGSQPEALTAVEEAFALSLAAAEDSPNDVAVQRDLSASFVVKGDFELQAGKKPEALADYRSGLEIRRKLVRQDPDNAEVLYDTSVLLNRIGDLLLSTNGGFAALVAYKESSDIRHRLLARDIENLERKRSLLTSLWKQAGATLAMGDAAGSTTVYEEIVGLRRDLVAQDPRNPRTTPELCQALEQSGRAKLRAGDPSGALAAFDSSLALLRRRADDRPDDIAAQRDVETILIEMAGMRRSAEDRAGARAALAEADSIAERLVAADPTNAQLRDDVSALRVARESLGP